MKMDGKNDNNDICDFPWVFFFVNNKTKQYKIFSWLRLMLKYSLRLSMSFYVPGFAKFNPRYVYRLINYPRNVIHAICL